MYCISEGMETAGGVGALASAFYSAEAQLSGVCQHVHLEQAI